MNKKNGKAHTIKEPFLRIKKREPLEWKKAWGIRAIAIIAALLFTGLVVLIATGINPLDIYSSMLVGSFGTVRRVKNTIKYMTPLLCLAIGLAPAFRMKFWNIGAQGQMLVGALGATIVALNFRQLPSAVLIPSMLVIGTLAGAVWGVIPAIFKAFWNTNETLFTLMMNYIATFLVMYKIDGWKDKSSAFGSFKQISPNAIMPAVFGESFFLCTIVVVLLAVGMYIYMRRSKHGYELCVVGESENTARYAGINVRKVIIRTMLLSGAICGFCGFLTASGINFTLASEMNDGYGFTAIVVAWLAKFNPFYMFLTSFMMIFFQNAATEISSVTEAATVYLSSIISGIILFFILGSEFFIRFKLIFRAKADKKGGTQE